VEVTEAPASYGYAGYAGVSRFDGAQPFGSPTRLPAGNAPRPSPRGRTRRAFPGGGSARARGGAAGGN
jgi:hypothetical protein